MRKKILPLFSSATLCVALLALMMPATTSAQFEYDGIYSKRQVANIVARAEQTSKRFFNQLDQHLDITDQVEIGFSEKSSISDDAKRLESALDNLGEEFERSDSWRESRSKVAAALDAARPVADWMRTVDFNPNVEMEWSYLRRDLNRLAATYNLPSV